MFWFNLFVRFPLQQPQRVISFKPDVTLRHTPQIKTLWSFFYDECKAPSEQQVALFLEDILHSWISIRLNATIERLLGLPRYKFISSKKSGNKRKEGKNVHREGIERKREPEGRIEKQKYQHRVLYDQKFLWEFFRGWLERHQIKFVWIYTCTGVFFPTIFLNERLWIELWVGRENMSDDKDENYAI